VVFLSVLWFRRSAFKSRETESSFCRIFFFSISAFFTAVSKLDAFTFICDRITVIYASCLQTQKSYIYPEVLGKSRLTSFSLWLFSNKCWFCLFRHFTSVLALRSSPLMLRLNAAPDTKDGFICTLTVMCGVARLVAGGMFRLIGSGSGASIGGHTKAERRRQSTPHNDTQPASMQPVWLVALEFQHVAVGG
jgi:hypothetical protein